MEAPTAPPTPGPPDPSASARGTWAWRAVALFAVAATLAFRLAIVEGYHVPGGSGHQYHQLATQLQASHRFAYGPPPAPLTHGMVPGYSLFLAFVARTVPAPTVHRHYLRAARANALLDVATALLVALALRRRGRLAAGLGFAFVATCPILVYMASFALPESLSTLLLTGALLLALRAGEGRPLRHALFAGVVIGLCQLVRSDAVAVVPAVTLALFWSGGPWRRRLLAAALCGLAALVVFSPWPIRNRIQFDGFYPLRSEWITMRGAERPTGMMDWMRTWATGGVRELYTQFVVEREVPFDMRRKDNILPAMYDSEAERQRVAALFDAYNRGLLTPEVDAGFRELARERARRAPFRTYVTLPALRLWRMAEPMLEAELPVRSPLLGLPAQRGRYTTYQHLLFASALVGALVLLRGGRRERQILAVVVVAVATRALLFAYVLPMPTQRYVVEVFPLPMGLAGLGVAAVVLGVGRRIRRRGAGPPG